jgi:hypothetical protein
MVVGHEAQPSVLEEIDRGETVDDPVRQQQPVDRAQHRRRVLLDGRLRVPEREADARRLVMERAGERRAEHRRPVVPRRAA